MSLVKNALIAVLAAALLGIAWVCWQQHAEIDELRAAALNRAERADLQKRVWELEKQNRQLTARSDAERPPVGVPGEPPPGGRPPGRGPNPLQQFANLRTFMTNPQVQALMTVQQKAAVEARYAALFKNLNLSPEQASRLTAILADRSSTLQDVAMAAREQGIDPRRDAAEYDKLMANARAEININIKSVIGDSGFAQFQTYEETLPQRNVVNQLQQRLSYGDTPLSNAQAEQLVQVMAANPPPASSAPSSPSNPNAADLGAIGMLFSGGGSSGGGGLLALADPTTRNTNATAPITSGALTQSQAVLSPPQVAAFQQLQQQQQSQQKLAQMMAENMGAQNGQPRGGPPPAPKGKKQ